MFDFGVLRELRKREGLTLQVVSERSGLSQAVISKLERNQTLAELPTLYRLGRVFGLTATDVLALAESRTSHGVEGESYESHGFAFESIRFGNLRCFRARAPAGARLRNPEIHRDDYEICWVLEGRVKLGLPHETHLLEAGMGLQFDAVQEHTYEAMVASVLFLVHLRKEKRF